MIGVLAKNRKEKPENRMRVELWVTGHAGAADEGKDIVCAAVSALVESFADWAYKKNSPNGHWSCDIDIEKGNADILCDVTSEHKAALSAAFEMTVNGLESIAKEYPEYISVTRKEYL